MKNFSGNQWERFHGLEPLLESCSGLSVLDVGMSDGLVSYEFARRGASFIHGIDISQDRVMFARRLFSAVPVRSRFDCLDCTHVDRFLRETEEDYDVVLFLAVYQKIEKAQPSRLPKVMAALVSKARKLFALRSSSAVGLSYRPSGFSLSYSVGWRGEVGPLNVFERGGASG